MKTYLDLFNLSCSAEFDKVNEGVDVEIIANKYEKLTVAYVEPTLYIIYPQTIGAFPSPGWDINLHFWKKGFKADNAKEAHPHFLDSAIQVHSGFLKEFLINRDAVDQQIRIFRPSRIVVTGYSQGAAVATLCFRDILDKQRTGALPVVPVIGFGFASPRLYNLAGAHDFNEALRERKDCSFERILNWHDLVTRVGPWFFDFCHVTPNHRRVVGAPHGRKHWLFGSTGVMHEPQNYQKSLQALPQGVV